MRIFFENVIDFPHHIVKMELRDSTEIEIRILTGELES
jgi:hypothetical protein